MNKMLRSIYFSVRACVKTQTGLTSVFNCPTGVRQGCCISPILFSFFLNNLKDFVSVDSYGIDAWYNQDVNDERSFISAFKERLLDTDIQCWRYDIEEMNELRTYRLLKENLTCEIYLNEINIATYRKAITKLRGGLLDLRANTDRYENIPYEDRICLMCKTSIEDEFHFLFECNNYGSIRQNFIPEYYYVHPSYEKFKDLMTRRNHDTFA